VSGETGCCRASKHKGRVAGFVTTLSAYAGTIMPLQASANKQFETVAVEGTASYNVTLARQAASHRTIVQM
jgi:hypothetical protein